MNRNKPRASRLPPKLGASCDFSQLQWCLRVVLCQRGLAKPAGIKSGPLSRDPAWTTLLMESGVPEISWAERSQATQDRSGGRAVAPQFSSFIVKVQQAKL